MIRKAWRLLKRYINNCIDCINDLIENLKNKGK
jgi:hypothetical protein